MYLGRIVCALKTQDLWKGKFNFFQKEEEFETQHAKPKRIDKKQQRIDNNQEKRGSREELQPLKKGRI
jgi:hypothetical protein